MKSVFQFSTFVAILFLVFAFSSKQQPTTNDDTISFKVNGVCGMCKERIEEALYITGIKSATWNKKTQMLTVSYKSQKITEAKIHQLVAEVGHDTDKVKAKDEVYKKLPDCCLYRDGVQGHDDK
jgi:periplasmic mercuric ion binding protein